MHTLDDLKAALRAEAVPERADHERAYLKSTDAFLGVTLPAGQRVVRAFRAANKGLPFDEVRALARGLWAGEFHEEKRLAVQLLDAFAASLAPDDWPMLARWVRESGSWDLIDEISAHLLGPLAAEYAHLDAEFDAWVRDDDLWVRRAALVSYVLRVRHAEPGAPARVRGLCEPLMTDRAYFVQKAVGWLLRECAVQEPEATLVFLLPWVGTAPRPTLREAVRKLPDAQRRRVLG
jgi:3-methyladenine DNA glycosylase AlkD